MDIPCAKFELGTYFGREGSLSYNIIQRNDEILIEGINFISLLYPAYDSEKFIDTETQNKYSIEMIIKSIDKFIMESKEDESDLFWKGGVGCRLKMEKTIYI